MIAYFEKIKDIIVDLHSRKFWGRLTIEIDFKDGGITSVHSAPKELIKL